MKFPNACRGIQILSFAELSALLGSLTAAVAIALSQFAGKDADVCSIAAAVLAALSSALTLLGLRRAAKDEDRFRKVLLAPVLCIAAAVCGIIFREKAFIPGLCALVWLILHSVVVRTLIRSARMLAERSGKKPMVARCNRQNTPAAFLYLLSILTCSLGASFSEDKISPASGILLLVSAGLTALLLLLILGFLGKTRQMLKD